MVPVEGVFEPPAGDDHLDLEGRRLGRLDDLVDRRDHHDEESHIVLDAAISKRAQQRLGFVPGCLPAMSIGMVAIDLEEFPPEAVGCDAFSCGCSRIGAEPRWKEAALDTREGS